MKADNEENISQENNGILSMLQKNISNSNRPRRNNIFQNTSDNQNLSNGESDILKKLGLPLSKGKIKRFIKK
jgi:hypothetical protein